MTPQPLGLKLSFSYSNLEDAGDDPEGFEAYINVSSSSSSLLEFLINEAGNQKKCRLRGEFRNDIGQTGSAEIRLTAISQQMMEEMRGKWSVYDPGSGGEAYRGTRELALSIRRGPHPSLYNPSLLAALGEASGYNDVSIYMEWPWDKPWLNRDQTRAGRRAEARALLAAFTGAQI